MAAVGVHPRFPVRSRPMRGSLREWPGVWELMVQTSRTQRASTLSQLEPNRPKHQAASAALWPHGSARSLPARSPRRPRQLEQLLARWLDHVALRPPCTYRRLVHTMLDPTSPPAAAGHHRRPSTPAPASPAAAVAAAIRHVHAVLRGSRRQAVRSVGCSSTPRARRRPNSPPGDHTTTDQRDSHVWRPQTTTTNLGMLRVLVATGHGKAGVQYGRQRD